jgi:hypothetical protein
MKAYEFQVDMRLDGKYYCRIYQFGIPDALASTDDYDEQDDAIEAAEELIKEYQANNAEA